LNKDDVIPKTISLKETIEDEKLNVSNIYKSLLKLQNSSNEFTQQGFRTSRGNISSIRNYRENKKFGSFKDSWEKICSRICNLTYENISVCLDSLKDDNEIALAINNDDCSIFKEIYQLYCDGTFKTKH
jgi:hypothetical protein